MRPVAPPPMPTPVKSKQANDPDPSQAGPRNVPHTRTRPKPRSQPEIYEDGQRTRMAEHLLNERISAWGWTEPHDESHAPRKLLALKQHRDGIDRIACTAISPSRSESLNMEVLSPSDHDIVSNQIQARQWPSCQRPASHLPWTSPGFSHGATGLSWAPVE